MNELEKLQAEVAKNRRVLGTLIYWLQDHGLRPNECVELVKLLEAE